MKKFTTLFFVAVFTASATLLRAQAPQPAPTLPPPPAAPVQQTPAPVAQPGDSTAAPAVPQPATTEQVTATPVVPENVPSDTDTNGSNSLRLNFQGASLDKVLDYLSDAAGFIIVKKARVSGTVDIVSKQPLTKDEAVDLLNSVLNDKGFGAIRNGRTLTIMNKDELKTGGIPVRTGGKAASIPKNDEVVTWILPVRFVEAAQLLKDLTPLVSINTAMTANESGNSIVITDTQANIHRVAEIIEAIDAGAENFTVVKVFKLKNADPVETADEITSLFPDDSRSGGGNSSPMQFGGGRMARLFGGGGPGGFGGGGGPGGFGGGGGRGGGGGDASARIKKRARVLAVPDPRTSSVIVSAAQELVEQIQQVVDDLDADNARHTSVTVFKVPNADPQQLMSVMQDVFNQNGRQQNRNNTANGALTTRQTTQNQQNSGGAQNRIGAGGRGGGGGIGGGGP